MLSISPISRHERIDVSGTPLVACRLMTRSLQPSIESTMMLGQDRAGKEKKGRYAGLVG